MGGPASAHGYGVTNVALGWCMPLSQHELSPCLSALPVGPLGWRAPFRRSWEALTGVVLGIWGCRRVGSNDLDLIEAGVRVRTFEYKGDCGVRE